MPESPRNINSGKPFARTYEAYIERGWLGVIPLPAGQKHPPPVGWTGRNARHPVQDDIDEWLAKVKYKNANIGLHMGLTPDGKYEIIGIDVDDYDEKNGGDQLKRLEAEHGRLPKTVCSSSRPMPSGIRFYRVPVGFAFVGKASSAIDIIQRAHRYAVVWPSWNPDSEAQYHWFLKDGTKVLSLEDIPDVNDLPILSPDDPETAGWFNFLTRNGMQDSGEELDMDMSVNEMYSWAANTFRKAVSEDDDICSRMQAAADYWVALIEDEESSHDKIIGAHWNLIALGSEGHYDWSQAVDVVEKAYVTNTLKRGKRSIEDLRGEVGRSKIQALRKVKAQIDSGKRPLATACSCYTPTEEDIALISAALRSQKKGGRGASKEQPNATSAEQRSAGARARSEDGKDGRAGGPFGAAPNVGEELGPDAAYGSDGSGVCPNGQPASVPKDPGEYAMNDFGNAEHWASIYKTHAFYVPEYDEWVMWNGVEWIRGEGMAIRSYDAVYARQRAYARQILNVGRTLAEADDPRAKETLSLARRWLAWADRSGNVGGVEAALKTASSRMILHERELDKDPYVLGVANGMIRLHEDGTVTLNDISKDHFITLNTGTPYIPWNEIGADYEEDADLWVTLVEGWLPDEDTRRWAQKLVGYTLLGDNRDRIAVFLKGATSTGKSTFLNAIMACLGDYAGPVDLSIFRGDRHTNPALISAFPRRIITASEASQANMLHADVFKRITGGDPISAELKYSNQIITRVPCFTPWVATNSAPNMPNADMAVQRRLTAIPFDVVVKEDPKIGYRVRESKSFRVAVLAWAVEGWRMYCEEGLKLAEAPESVQLIKAQLMGDLSDLGTFIDERLTRMPTVLGAELPPQAWRLDGNDAFDEYEDWCMHNRTQDRDRLSRKRFTRQMQEYGIGYGIVQRDGQKRRCFLGVQLKRLKVVEAQ